ncbi:putative serine dehydratase domain-containing protein [Bisporella sp. PMI_857]|nr:putative serine dehydratase domain-containing protein [Bisporella sp. PMI_857]
MVCALDTLDRMASPYPADIHRYIGKHKTELPSPSLCLSLPTIKENARIFHENVKAAGVDFRAHVKSNKTLDVTRILLGSACTKVIASTLREIRGLQPLIAEGIITDVLYGLPIGPSMLPEMDILSKTVTTRLLVDHIDHISLLSKYERCPENKSQPWSVFIKLDMGTKRAGLPPKSAALKELVRVAEDAPNVDIYGFYSYSAKAATSRTIQDAEAVLQEHIDEVLRVTRLLRDQTRPLTLSVGSSPTARVIRPIREKCASNITMEIHAGTLIYNDLQQLSTGTVGSSGLAMTVITEICSIYPDRNEALINAGVLALTREPGHLSGIARVRDSNRPGWIVDRVSQEHGILAYVGDGQRKVAVEHEWKIGDKIELDLQHTCIVGAMYGWQFVIDQEGVVRDIYYPWKWW